MSDPVSSMDVEDVLSSIRRLVSEESKGQNGHRESAREQDGTNTRDKTEASSVEDSISSLLRRPVSNEQGDPAGIPPSNDIAQTTRPNGSGTPGIIHPFANPDDPDAAPAGGKLVLTAALRVADDMQNPSPANTPTIDAPAQNDAPALRAANPRPERLHLRTVADRRLRNDNDKAVLADDTVRPSVRARIFDTAPEELLFDRASKAMEQAEQGIAPDATGSTTANPPHVNNDTKPGQIIDDATPSQGALKHPAKIPDISANIDADEVSADAKNASATPQDLRFGAGFVRHDQDRGAVSASRGDDTSRDDGRTDADTAAPDDAEPSTINFSEQEDSVLDEDSLRDLISQMVREELQGELGDRITRNVRKLVRREIQRALASREFE